MTKYYTDKERGRMRGWLSIAQVAVSAAAAIAFAFRGDLKMAGFWLLLTAIAIAGVLWRRRQDSIQEKKEANQQPQQQRP
jgi:membrane protein implicated in regulation of membrane protease activity